MEDKHKKDLDKVIRSLELAKEKTDVMEINFILKRAHNIFGKVWGKYIEYIFRDNY